MASCATPVIHVLCFRCITCVEMHMYHMCSRYTCNTNMYIIYTYITHVVLHMQYMFMIYTYYTCSSTHVIHVYDIHLHYMCETCILQVFYTCIKGV